MNKNHRAENGMSGVRWQIWSSVVLDRDVRIAVVSDLSRRSTFASEVVSLLSVLARDDPDDEVRDRIKDAISNIRGYDPGFSSSFK